MAVDAALWFILAGTIAFIYCGCICTARNKKPLNVRDGTFDRNVGRGAPEAR